MITVTDYVEVNGMRTWYDERGGGEPLVLLHGGWIFTPTAGGEMPEWVVAAYAEVSPDGRDHFPVVAAKIVEAAVADPLSLTEAELAGMAARKLVMASDDDIVHLEHTLALYGRSTVPN